MPRRRRARLELRPVLSCVMVSDFRSLRGDIVFRPLLARQSPAPKISFQTRRGKTPIAKEAAALSVHGTNISPSTQLVRCTSWILILKCSWPIAIKAFSRACGPNALFLPPQAAASDYSHDGNQRESAQKFRAGALAQCVGCQAQRILARGDRLFRVEVSTGAEQSGGPDYLQGGSCLDSGASQREGH